MSYEPVHTIWDYYDGPREGIADFQGKPHLYKCQFSEVDDDWTDLYWLMEIDQDTFELAKEQYEIFLRWRAEFQLGKVPLETHPVLPPERARYEELRNIIGDRLKLEPVCSVTRRARFNRDPPAFSLVEWVEP